MNMEHTTFVTGTALSLMLIFAGAIWSSITGIQYFLFAGIALAIITSMLTMIAVILYSMLDELQTIKRKLK